MAEVWASPMPPRLKLPALALADMADDAGRCWPSVPTLCKKTGQSERTVQGALAELEAGGALRREERAGRSTVYHITPATFAPPQGSPPPPADPAPPPPQLSRGSPAESAPRIFKETSGEPSKEGAASKSTPALALEPPGERKKNGHNGHRIGWDPLAKTFTGITDADKLRWQEAYPHISVPDQIAALAAWLAVPGRKKHNHEAYIVRNLTRANDRKDR